jgi:NADPH:quinone reductase-like Zn-dependent oxidoreductase
MKAVRFDQYGGVDVLKVVDAPVPEQGQGEALIKVKAGSINPGEAKIREGCFTRAGRRHSPRAKAQTSPGS